MSHRSPSVWVGCGEVVVTKLRQVSLHAEVAGVHTNPPAIRQNTIYKTLGIAVGAVGAHVTSPPHLAVATCRVMSDRRVHKLRGCCPCHSHPHQIPEKCPGLLTSGGIEGSRGDQRRCCRLHAATDRDLMLYTPTEWVSWLTDTSSPGNRPWRTTPHRPCQLRASLPYPTPRPAIGHRRRP